MKPSLLFLFIALPIVSHCFSDISFDECGKTKGCLLHDDCNSSNGVCHVGATWKKIVVEGRDYIEFELAGAVPPDSGYVSLGFSEDQLSGDDGVVGCFHNSNSFSDPVKFYAGYNRRNPRTGEVENVHIDKLPEGFLVSEGEDLGGKYNRKNVLQCRFRRLVTPASDVDLLKDLNEDKSYHLIHSRGRRLTTNGFGTPLPGGEAFSNKPVTVSSSDLTYGSMTGYPGEGTSLAKAHGACMVLAWIFCSSVGIILARYYKQVWPNSGLLRERVWFQAHRILQGTCVALTILGLILILVYTQGRYSQTTTWPHYVHPILGIIVIILTLLNPLLAVCRCHPAHERRPWFNWTHFIVGTVAYILSVPTMMLGLRMPAAGIQLASLDYPNAILLFFVIFQFICEISLEIHGCIYYKRNENRRHEYELAMDQYTSAIRVQSGPYQKPEEPEPSGRMFKYFVIGLHATVCALVAVLLIIIIAVH